MDFHSLTRKELQTLCKKNKIPANITNVAMADALTALENVVGLEEFINQSQSPEEIAESPAVPRTASRASSLARNDQDPQTAQPLTRTRRTATRRRMIDLDQDQDQENKKNVNLPETPAVPARIRRAAAAEKVNQIVGTPAAQSERGRRPAASVQRTRQSVRLLEKTMAQLSLKDKGKAEPVKMMDVSESFEKTSDNEVSSNIESVENKEETKDVVELQDESVPDQEEVHHDEKFDDMLADKSMSVTVIDEMESVAAAVTEFPSETENASSELMGPEQQCLADNVSDENSGKVMEDVVPNHVEAEESIAVDEIQKDLDHFVENHTAADEVPSDKNFAKVIDDVVPHHVEAEESIAADEIQKDLDNFVMESTAADESPYDKNSDKVMDDVVQHHVEAEANEKDSDHFVTESTAADDSPSDYDSGSDASVVDQLDTTAAEPECVEKEMIILENVVAPNNQKLDTEELIDVSLIEAEVPMSNEDETAKSVKQISNPSEENGNGNPDSTMKNLVDVYIMQAEGADLLPFQFPRPTPVESSSKKKQEANEKLTTVAADNKENIDSSGMKVESKKDKVKKNKNTVEEDMMLKALEDKSLRMLTKMLKEKLKINKKKNDKINNEEESVVKVVGKTRPALQTLEENQMHPGEPKNEN